MQTATATKSTSTGFDLPVIGTKCPACGGAGPCEICGDPTHPCHLEQGRFNIAPVVFLFEVRGLSFTAKRLGLTLEQVQTLAISFLGTRGPAAREVYGAALAVAKDLNTMTTTDKLAAAMGIR